MKKRNWSLFICIVLLLTSLHTPIIAGATGDAQDVDRLFTEQEVSEYRTEGTYPTKEGYVFAGWYKDSSRETPVTGNTPADGAYAKFVNKKVLSVMFQLTDGTTISSETTNLRVITSVDSLSYQQVGFVLSVNGNSQEITSNTVYNTIAAYVNEDQQKYQPKDVFDETESEYFVTKVVTGIKNTSFKKAINFTPFWVTMDGTKVTATDDRTIAIFDEVKLVANPLGFIAASTDPTHSKVEKTTFGGEEVIKGDFRKVIFEGIQTLETANKSINPEFHASGYTHVQFDMYIETAGSAGINFNATQLSIWTNGKGSDWSNEPVGGIGTKGDILRTYNADGEKTPIKEGAWYTVSMRVDANSTDVSVVSLNQIHTIAYFKNLTFTNAFPVEKKFTANPLGFIAASTDPTHSKVEKTTFGGEEVIKGDFRKVIFEGIQTLETANKSINPKFLSSGYTHVQFDMYIETAGSGGINFNTSQLNIWTNGQGYDWSVNGSQGDYLRTYNADGEKDPIKEGAWYTVSMRVDANSTDVSVVSLDQIHTIAYFKNLTFTNAFPVEKKFTANPLGFIAASTDPTHSKVEKTTFGGEEVIKGDFRKVIFEGIQTLETANKSINPKFLSSGYTHVQFDMYIETAGSGGINFNTSQLNIWTNGQGYDWSVNGSQGDYLRTYTEDGVRSPIKGGAWYTVSMRVDANSTDVSVVSLNQIHTIAYFKNLTFANAFPVEKQFTANPLGFISSGASHTTVTQTTFGGEEVIKVNGRKVCFEDVIDAANNNTKGAFFGSGYQYISFDVYYNEWHANYENRNLIMVNTSSITSSAEVDENYNASDWDNPAYVWSYKDGVQENIKAGAWYTVYVKVESYSSDVSFCSPGSPSEFYMKNLTFTNSLPQ